ncbi:MAG: phosphotransferase [Candidatus Saccharimonadales bacterium]
MDSKIIEIKELNHADRDASVKLVSIENHKFVLKTDDLREIAAQKFFNQQLEEHNIPALLGHAHVHLQPNQILLEYVEESLTLGNALSEERCRKWGEIVSRMHAIQKNKLAVLDPEGNQVSVEWPSYIKKYIDAAVARHRSLPCSLGDDLIGQIQNILYDLVKFQPTELSVTHGDLHVHNVLVKGEELILFDKFADFLVAPAAFDIALLYAEAFSGAAFPELQLSSAEQQKYFQAFMDGYGPLSAEQQKWLDHFILLRAFYRWPNRFAPHSGEVIRLMARKLK